MHGSSKQYIVKRFDMETVTHNPVTGEKYKVPQRQRVSTCPFGVPVMLSHIAPYMPEKLRKQVSGLYPGKSLTCKLELCGSHPADVEITRTTGGGL